LGTRPHGDGLCRVRRGPSDAVGIREDEARFVGSVRLEVEDAAREHVRRDQVPRILLIDPLALQPQQREALLPVAGPLFAIRDVHAGVAVVIARDEPLEAEIDERWMIDDKLAGRYLR